MQKQFILTAVTALVISGCNPYSPMQSDLASQKTPGSNGDTTPVPAPTPKSPATPNPNNPQPPSTTKPPTPTSPTLSMCGPLSFNGVSWSPNLSAKARLALALSLSITGSFEGTQSWSTIANNSDGQGMSLGLLQQNFGQGTLQPLMIEMFLSHASEMSSYYAPADLTSLRNMLKSWDTDDALMLASFNDELFPEYLSNALEEDSADIVVQSAADTKSVTWAKNNVYSGSSFVTRWKNSFQTMAASNSYRSLQIGAAVEMFAKARAYFAEFQFTELRSMLLMFDFVVQNGGFTATHRANYRAWLAKNPKADEAKKAKQLLEIRLVSVRSEYRADVRSRKSAIINNTGKVHGSNRNLSKEYCFAPGEKLTPTF